MHRRIRASVPARPVRDRRDHGASLVEFALVFPVMAMLVFGMITAGLAYSRNLTLSHAAQQTARYGSTLPLSSYTTTNDWLDAMGQQVIALASGDLDESAPGRAICVAYVDPAGGATASRTVTTADASPVYGTSPCFTDELPTSEVRIQVAVSRDDTIDLVVFGRIGVDLARDAVAKYQVES